MNKNGFSHIILIVLLVAIAISLLVFFKFPTLLSSFTNTGKYDSTKKIGYFHGYAYNVLPEDKTPIDTNVLGSKSKNKEKRIEVDLSKQKLYAYEGDKKRYSYPVSTGLWNKTPTGEFKVYLRYKYSLMTGGSKALGTYYYLPNVPYTMYFYQDYGIHGAYWHSNFGHPMSHGCINMKPEEAKVIFEWSDYGTKVLIYGTTPKS